MTMSNGNRKSEFKFYDLLGPLLVALLIIGPFYITYDEIVASRDQVEDARREVHSVVVEEEDEQLVAHEETDNKSGCNMFSGRWVYDDKSYPLYKAKDCAFIKGDFACEEYGRKDLKFQHWRWQPHHCDLPRFNSVAFLEKIRGKKVMFVGDSLNGNQWTSMVCLIESTLPSPSPESAVTETGNMLTYEVKDYNATVGFYWSPFLVESNNDDPHFHRLENRVVRIEAIEKHAKHWTDADILIFNSYMWWLKQKMTILWGSLGSADAVYRTVDMNPRLYEMAINTWSDWLEFNINRTKTKLFFMSLSPNHEVGAHGEKEENCYKTSEPNPDETYWGYNTNPNMMKVVESGIHKLARRGVKVEYLNITHLSDMRRDAHPSIYKKFYRNITEEQLKDPRSYSDCTHWCLPGVPDTWNQILYAYIINS